MQTQQAGYWVEFNATVTNLLLFNGIARIQKDIEGIQFLVLRGNWNALTSLYWKDK